MVNIAIDKRGQHIRPLFLLHGVDFGRRGGRDGCEGSGGGDGSGDADVDNKKKVLKKL